MRNRDFKRLLVKMGACSKAKRKYGGLTLEKAYEKILSSKKRNKDLCYFILSVDRKNCLKQRCIECPINHWEHYIGIDLKKYINLKKIEKKAYKYLRRDNE